MAGLHTMARDAMRYQRLERQSIPSSLNPVPPGYSLSSPLSQYPCIVLALASKRERKPLPEGLCVCVCLGRGIQLSPVGLLLHGAVSTVLVAAGEDGNEITFLEAAVAFVCGAESVGIEEVLGHHCEFGEDRTVPSVL